MKEAAAVAALALAMTAAAAAPGLRCALEAPARVAAGAVVPLRFSLTNTGAAPLMVLRWNSPFEGAWFAAFVTVTRDGRAVGYQGPMKKRSEPRADHYVHLDPGATTRAQVELGQAFDIARPGRYHVVPHIELIDVFDATPPLPALPRETLEGFSLSCPPVDVIVTPR